MFVHFVEAPETSDRAGGRYKDIGSVIGLQYILSGCCSLMSKSSYGFFSWLEPAAIAVTPALRTHVKLKQTALNCARANVELEIFQKR